MTKEPFNIDTLDEFTRAYMECALWSSTATDKDDQGEEIEIYLNDAYDIEQIAPETREKMIADCAKFQADNLALIEGDNPRYNSNEGSIYSYAGHDFWLTRNGHGAGFWDGDWPVNGEALTTACKKAYPSIDLYIGDDGLIYS